MPPSSLLDVGRNTRRYFRKVRKLNLHHLWMSGAVSCYGQESVPPKVEQEDGAEGEWGRCKLHALPFSVAPSYGMLSVQLEPLLAAQQLAGAASSGDHSQERRQQSQSGCFRTGPA